MPRPHAHMWHQRRWNLPQRFTARRAALRADEISAFPAATRFTNRIDALHCGARHEWHTYSLKRPASPTWDRAPCGGQNWYADRSEHAEFGRCASHSQRQIVTHPEFCGVLLWKIRAENFALGKNRRTTSKMYRVVLPFRESSRTVSLLESSPAVVLCRPNPKAAILVSPAHLSSPSTPPETRRA